MADHGIDLTRTYDAIVIGSGAAGGMAAHFLTSRGLKVLMLEAGKKLPIEKELRSMQWPYDNANRGTLPPDGHSLTFDEYTIRNPPYGPGFEKSKHLQSYVGSTDYVKNIVVDERENPFTGTNYAWVRARCLVAPPCPPVHASGVPSQDGIKYRQMRFNAKHAILTLIICGLTLYPSWAQRKVQKSASLGTKRSPDGDVSTGQASLASSSLTPDEGLAVIAAALDSRIHSRPARDCSHLVHAIYDRAGFPYKYAPSSDLYKGTSEFQRVTHLQAGDLAVWRGHVGIVVNPAQHVFFSAMRSGLGTDTYDAPYWKQRGQVRFYRYIKGPRRD